MRPAFRNCDSSPIHGGFCARRRPRFDTLRSGRGCDFWTRLDPEFANFLEKTTIPTHPDAAGRPSIGFVISRSAVRVRSPAPLESITLRRSRVQTYPTRVTTVSPPIRRWIGLATPPPRRSTNSSGQPAHSTRGQPSTTAGQVRNRPAKSRQSEGVRHEPAAVRGGRAGRTLSSVTATPGRTLPLPARTPDPSFRSEERAAGSTANACSPSTGRIHRSVGMRRSPATVGPGVRRAG